MISTQEDKFYKELRGECGKCFGLCCIALYFSASEGFPTNKDAGNACINLKQDFTCAVHKNLRSKGLKGCIHYDCFGAGQKIAQVSYGGRDWRQAPETANKMFEAFLIMRQLHEMMWYLAQAILLQADKNIKDEIRILLDNTENLAHLDVDSLLALDVETHRDKVNMLLKKTSEQIRSKACSGRKSSSKNKSALHRRLDYFGADLRKASLRGADLRGVCLIAANLRGVDLSFADFIGADLRDADFSGADLSKSIFLTQAQINAAKGDSNTKLPSMLIRPTYWAE